MTEKVQCKRCQALHPATLFSGGDQLCVYCKADDAEKLPQAKPVEEVEQVDTSVEEKARAELALRFLPRNRLLPVVE